MLEEFVGSNIPEYAILSHPWKEDEVTYAQYVKGDYQQMKRYSKIDMTCCIAEKDGISYALFRWYEGVKLCYAYPADLPYGADWIEKLPKFQCKYRC